MRELAIQIRLREDVIVNERPANAGGHKGLDYLPGYLLLGAAAARLYNAGDMSPDDTWRLFHSGLVQFGNALPLVDGHPTWPLPLCWHEAKGESAIAGETGCLLSDRVFNLQRLSLEADQQPKQLREGYVRADGYRHSVKRSFRMKTAINPRTGRIAESQLFGYESMNAGQSFVARIRAADALPDPLWQRLTAVFENRGELLLGRSRSAEYGRVEVQHWPGDLAALEPQPAEMSADGSVTLWCLSDLALLDDLGQPTLKPSARALGLTRGEIDWERSYLRFRRYAVWNQYREGYDVERQVIRQGSVIALKPLDPPLTELERATLTGGVGLYWEAGLGRLSIDAKLLADGHPAFEEPLPEPTDAKTPDVKKPEHPLIVWLEELGKSDAERQAAERASQSLRKRLKDCYASARKFAGVPDHLPIGPSPAQWGTLYEAARVAESANPGKLRNTIFDQQDGLCKRKGEGWQDEFRETGGKEVISFYDWFSKVARLSSSDQLPENIIDRVQTLRLFLREAQRVAQHEHGRADHQEETP